MCPVGLSGNHLYVDRRISKPTVRLPPECVNHERNFVGPQAWSDKNRQETHTRHGLKHRQCPQFSTIDDTDVQTSTCHDISHAFFVHSNLSTPSFLRFLNIRGSQTLDQLCRQREGNSGGSRLGRAKTNRKLTQHIVKNIGTFQT